MNRLDHPGEIKLPPRIAAKNKNKTIPIGIVGLNFGNHILDLLRQEPARKLFRVVAVCDLDIGKARAKAASLGVRAYGDVDSLLADPEIAAVGLFTGPAGRAGLIGKIVRAGKDVLTTKPFEVDSREAAAVLGEAQDLGRVVHLNSPGPLLSPDLERIARWREEFDLGRPVGARAEAWVSYREKADGGWYDDPVRCPLAPVFRIGIYLINDLIRLFGEVEAVQVFHSRLFTGRPTPDNGQLSLRFANGALGTVFSSFCVDDGQFYRNGLTLNFERGTIYRSLPPGFWSEADHDVCNLLLVTKRDGRQVIRRSGRRVELSGAYQWKAFHRAVSGEDLSRVPHATTPGQIVNGLEVIEAMSRAERSGEMERVASDPLREALAA